MRLLKDGATSDLDTITEEIDDAARNLSARSTAQQQHLARSRIARARIRLRKARQQRAELRLALLLDDEEADGLS